MDLETKVKIVMITIIVMVGGGLIFFSYVGNQLSIRRKEEEEELRKKFFADLEKKYCNIPEEYKSYCISDDMINLPTIEKYSSEIITEKLQLFAEKVSLQGKKEKSVDEEKVNEQFQKDEEYNKRMLDYRTLIFDIKLKVAPSYMSNFVSEAEDLIGNAKKESPSTWISFEKFISWCLKYVEAHPNTNININKPQNNGGFDKIEERLQFQENRVKKV
jgi:hypothetical protein